MFKASFIKVVMMDLNILVAIVSLPLFQVEIVLVPKNVLTLYDHGRSLEEMRQQLDREFPSRREIFHSFATGEKWQHYKLDVLDKLRTKKWLLNQTTLEDVPQSIQKQYVHQREFYSMKSRLPSVR